MCQKCVCTAITPITTRSRTSTGLPEAIHIRGTYYAFPEVLHKLHPILALGGRYLLHTWAWISHLLRNRGFSAAGKSFSVSKLFQDGALFSGKLADGSLFVLLGRALAQLLAFFSLIRVWSQVFGWSVGLFVCFLPVFIAFQFVTFFYFVCGVAGFSALPY